MCGYPDSPMSNGPEARKNGEIMSRVTLAAPIDAAQVMAGAAFAGGRHRRTNPWVKKVKISMVVALACGAAAAGTTFAVKTITQPNQATAMASGAHAGQTARRGAGLAASLRVLSISPGNSADPVTAVNPVRVVFSAPLAPSSPLPTFSPAVAGRWNAAGGRSIVFTPAVPFQPSAEVTLQIPAGSSGLRSATGALLAAPVTTVFQAGGRSTLRMEQLLAQLGYLPMTWTRQGAGVADAVAASYMKRRAVDDTPAGGMLTWQSGYPSALTSQWQPGQPGVILSGALMAFQLNQGLPMTGTVYSGVWSHLLNAAAQNEYNGNGYSFALVSKTLPETITVWHNGRVVVHGLANTGAADTPTPDGTFPVYLRRQHQVMRGLMPNGIPYADPVQFVSFFNGDYAVHSMNRPSYGSAQSLGCVELPLTEAQQVWPYLTYGTLVTVTG
jgi:peptidoglycan hydrolase-like protein with peptidoglycan-binding domain